MLTALGNPDPNLEHSKLCSHLRASPRYGQRDHFLAWIQQAG